MQTRRVLIVTTLICSLLVATSVLADDDPPPITIKETVTSLGRVPEGWVLFEKELIASPDLAHVGCAATKAGKGVLMMDGEELARFECDEIKRVIFSPDSRRLACVVETKDYHSFAVVDGIIGPRYSGIGHLNFCFRPDSKSVAYIAEDKRGNEVIVVDNKELKTYTEVGEIAYSPDSAHFAYAANFGLPISGLYRCSVVLDGRRTKGSYFDIDRLTFSPDSKRLAYVAKSGTAKLIVDGKPVAEADLITSFVFSPDSQRVACRAGKWTGRKHVVVDGKAHSEYRSVIGMTLSPDSKRLLYVAKSAAGSHLVLDGIAGPPYDAGGPLPIFSPDSAHVADAVRKSGQGFVVVDGVEGKRYDKILFLVFSPDSSHLAFGAKNEGRAFIVLDGKEGQGYDEVWQPLFSPDSAHIAYLAREKDEVFLVVDGVEAASRFSSSVASVPPDWMDAMYESNKKRLQFTSPTTVRGIFRRDPGPEFLRLEVEILPAPEEREAK